jgi:hypothetical protein
MGAALEDLLQRHRVWRGGAIKSEIPAISSGYDLLDAPLPGRGWPSGALTEILGSQEATGELELLLPAVAALTWAGKRVAWLAPPHLPYAPALVASGVDLSQLAVVRAPRRRDALWAAEQILRAGCCHALLGWFRRAGYDELRRLAVAAESSPTCALLFRPPEAAAESSPACLRLALEPAGDALCVRILKRRGASAAVPLRLPVKRPFHALGRTPFPVPAAARAGADRRLGLPVHA